MLELEIIKWYLQSPALVGAVFPFLVSAVILIAKVKDLRHVTHRGLVSFLILFVALLLNIASGYWTNSGFHILPASLIVAVALVYFRRLPLTLVYSAVFFTCLVPDVLSAGIEYNGIVGWWDMVGGYGLHDGLFLYPLAALASSYLILHIGKDSKKQLAPA